MKSLEVVRLKPNPRGKDRSHGHATPAQLGAEWVDIKNIGASTINLSAVNLFHLAYPVGGGEPKWELVCKLPETLAPGKVLRVHSGEHRSLDVLHPEDRQGADYATFTGRDAYVWNNSKADTALLWNTTGQGSEIDQASYDALPPEGVVLVRSGQKLVPAVATASGW